MTDNLPRVLFTGSRGWPFYLQVVEVATQLRDVIGPYTLVHGAARGLDTFAGMAARALELEEDPMPANWAVYGKAAGVIRNAVMLAKKPVLVVAFWHGQSRGTLDCINKAVNTFRIPTIIYRR